MAATPPKMWTPKKRTEESLVDSKYDPNLSNRQKELLKQKEHINIQTATNTLKEHKSEEAKLKGLVNTKEFLREEKNWGTKTYQTPSAFQPNVFEINTNVWKPKVFLDAIVKNDESVLDIYLKHGFDVKKPYDYDMGQGLTLRIYPLTVAAMHGRLDLVRLFLALGADPSATDSKGSAYMAAVRTGHTNIVNLLRQAVINIKGEREAQAHLRSPFPLPLEALPSRKYFTSYEKKAHLGDINSQIALGQMYANGVSTPYDGLIPKNMEKARYWLQKAANQGSTKAEERIYKLFGIKNTNKKTTNKNNSNMNDLISMFGKMSLGPTQYGGKRKTRRVKHRNRTRKH